MNVETDLLYTKNDEWIRVDGEMGFIGVTDYAQDQLSDIVYVEIQLNVGDRCGKGEPFGAIESVKAASDVYLPVDGKLEEINDLLEEAPELINTDPYGDAWMVKIKISDPTQLEALMDAAAYEDFLTNRDH